MHYGDNAKYSHSYRKDNACNLMLWPDIIRTFTYTMRKGDSEKLRIGNIPILIAKTTHRTWFYDGYQTEGFSFKPYTKVATHNSEFTFLLQRQRIKPNFMSGTKRTFMHTITIHNRDSTNSGVFTFKLHIKSTTQTTKSNGWLIFSYI